jgi:preprotein translocase subunit SecG
MDEMVDVNVSGHGKSFHNSSESLFRDRGDRNVRRSSVFAVGLEDIEYDAVDMSKRRCFSGLVFALIVSIVIVTTVVVVRETEWKQSQHSCFSPCNCTRTGPCA